MIMRQIMGFEKPDAIMFFTDPRYYIWLFRMENEIHQKIPMIYYNIWDDTLSWWNNEKVQRSIKIFCDQYAYVNKNKINDLKNILIK